MRHHIQTRAVHAGESPDPATQASSPNIVMSTTYVADPDASFSIEGQGKDAPHVYTRWSNPTVDQMERKLADLEEAEACVGFASGMGAIAGLFLHVLKQGDHLVMNDVTYAGASELANDILPKMGIRVTKVDTSDLEAVREAVTPGTRLVYLESPCNPLMRLCDIAAISEIAKEAGALVAVDSTFATPLATRPIQLGADFVVHSLTKYLGGHGDAVGGALLGPAEVMAKVRQEITVHLGGIISPFNAWLIMRGMATLPLRMEAHSEGAMAVAEFLEAHPGVTDVKYPGLPSHPQHELARRQMALFSGMLTFQTRDTFDTARMLAQHLKIIHYAVSLGHHRSLVFHLPTKEMLNTSFKLSATQEAGYRQYAGDGILRLSVGIEAPEDLCKDLATALVWQS